MSGTLAVARLIAAWVREHAPGERLTDEEAARLEAEIDAVLRRAEAGYPEGTLGPKGGWRP